MTLMGKFAVTWAFIVPTLLFAQVPQKTQMQPARQDAAIAAAIAKISPIKVQQHIETLVGFGTRSTLSSEVNDLAPGKGINAAADWIESEFQRYSAECGGCLEVKRDTFVEPGKAGSRIVSPTKLVNVYAILRGHDPEQAKRMYLVTGHYDSRVNDVMDAHADAPGANDDASGVAVSLECARVLSKLKLPATLVFVAVAGEEQGLNGSTHLAKVAKEEGWQLDGVFNNDIVGGDRSPGQNPHVVRVFSEGIPSGATPEEIRRIAMLGAESDSVGRELARSVYEVSKTYFQPGVFGASLQFRRDRFLRSGDHVPFAAQGYPAVRFTEWQENFAHQHQAVRVENGVQYGDLLKYVDTTYVANVARLNAAAMATLAMAPGRPEKVTMIVSNLDNATELKWEPPVGAAAGTKYEVVWRATTEPVWTHAKATTETHIRLDVSKDNVIFGVRSMDAAGHRSVAVLPVPGR